MISEGFQQKSLQFVNSAPSIYQESPCQFVVYGKFKHMEC